jgi:hypothetical protein
MMLLRELDRITELTIVALDSLLEKHAPWSLAKVLNYKKPMTGDLKKRRTAMANAHNIRVAALVDALGKDDAVRLGRQVLFQVGLNLGKETRCRLGVGDSVEDLLRAARVLYRILGIKFEVQWKNKTHAQLIVHRCALADDYTATACLVLSATDEGVVQGLNPRIAMMFKERITAGAPKCIACLKL